MTSDALPALEQAIVDQANHDGEGWALAPGADQGAVNTLAEKGLVRHHAGRWQLTPAGFAPHTDVRARRTLVVRALVAPGTRSAQLADDAVE